MYSKWLYSYLKECVAMYGTVELCTGQYSYVYNCIAMYSIGLYSYV